MATPRAKPTATRLAFCGHSDQHGTVDGAWWPRSTELRVELPDLVAILALWIGPVRRVLYDPTLWNLPPSRIIRRGSVITVDPYTLVDRDTIYLMGTHSRNWLLYVVPPTSSDADVRQLLRAVDDADDPLSVKMLREVVRGFPGEGKTP